MSTKSEGGGITTRYVWRKSFAPLLSPLRGAWFYRVFRKKTVHTAWSGLLSFHSNSPSPLSIIPLNTRHLYAHIVIQILNRDFQEVSCRDCRHRCSNCYRNKDVRSHVILRELYCLPVEKRIDPFFSSPLESHSTIVPPGPDPSIPSCTLSQVLHPISPAYT